MLDVPDDVRRRVIADGNAVWLDELPSVVESLARDWSLTIGTSLRGGFNAFVVEATLADGTAAVLQVGVPGSRRQLGFEAAALRRADGDGCARLLRDDLDRARSCSSGSEPPCTTSCPIPRPGTTCCATSRSGCGARSAPTSTCQPVRTRHAGMPTCCRGFGEETGRPCSQETLDDALACAERRHRAHDDRRAVLVHGDANALQAADSTFKLVDPGGLRAEPACDLGTIVRCNPDIGDDLRARAERLAARTGVEVSAIWEWGTIYRVTGGLFSRRIGFQPFGDLLLAEADRLTRSAD